MNIQNDKPTEVPEVIEAKAHKRNIRKNGIKNISSKKVCLEAVKYSKSTFFSNAQSMQSEDSPKKRKSERVVSGLKSKRNSLVEDLDQIQGIGKKLKEKVKSDNSATNSTIVKDEQPDAGEPYIIFNSPLIPIFRIKKEPEDLIEDNEDAIENSIFVKNAEVNALKLGKTDSPQHLILVKQWNAALKEELVILRRKETAQRLKNEILLGETSKLNKEMNALKRKITMNRRNKELEKKNRMLKNNINDTQHDKEQIELQKEALTYAIKELDASNKVIMSENKNLKHSKKEFSQELKKFIKTRKENNNLKCENNILEHSIRSFKKNNQDMCNLISELEKHNKTLNEKLMEFQDGKEAITLQHEKELLQIQVKEIKSQNQTMVIENECMLMEIKEFVTSNNNLHKTLTELEKHNTAIYWKLKDVEEKNRAMSKEILYLECEINDITKKGS